MSLRHLHRPSEALCAAQFLRQKPQHDEEKNRSMVVHTLASFAVKAVVETLALQFLFPHEVMALHLTVAAMSPWIPTGCMLKTSP